MANQTIHKEPAVWGGVCPEAQAFDLITAWLEERDIPYRIWEMASEISFEKGSILNCEEFKWLERARLFGAGGDLSLRRDHQQFRWWFVGPASANLPGMLTEAQIEKQKGLTCHNFWEAEPNAVFNQETGTALLWGEQQQGQVALIPGQSRYFEDRVASANLSYPVTENWQRAQVVFNTYSRAGRIEFTWLLCLDKAA
jgi:hypothetical protein